MAFDIMSGYGIPNLRRKNTLGGFGDFQMPDMGNLGPPSEDPFDTSNQYGDLFKADFQPSAYEASKSDSPDEDMFAKLRAQFHPQSVASDRFNRMVDQFPQQESPSLGRRLVVMGAGLGKGGFADQSRIMNEPYVRDLEAWKTQIEPASKAAEQERLGNVNERQLLGQMITADTANRRTTSAEKKYRDEILSREKIAGDKNEIARIRADAYKLKNESDAWEFSEKGARLIAFNPSTGEKRDMGPSGLMDQRELENLKGQWGVKRAEAQGMNATELEAARQGGRPFQVNGKSYVVIDGKAVEISGLPEGTLTKPGSPKSSGNTLDDIRANNEHLKNVFELVPGAGKWITREPGGKYVMKPRPVAKEGGFFGGGVTQEQVDDWDRIRKEVDSNYQPSNPTKQPIQSIQVPPEQLGRTPAAGRGTQYGQSSTQSVTPPKSQGPPQGSPYNSQQIQAMSPTEKRQRAIGYLDAKGVPINEDTIRIAIENNRFMSDVR